MRTVHEAPNSHPARADYLERPAPTAEPTFGTAAQYFAAAATQLSEDDHRAIRDRGAEIAGTGRDAVVERLTRSIAGLRTQLPAEPADRTMSVASEAVMRLDDYLWRRAVGPSAVGPRS